jgi:hypothetical protein
LKIIFFWITEDSHLAASVDTLLVFYRGVLEGGEIFRVAVYQDNGYSYFAPIEENGIY